MKKQDISAYRVAEIIQGRFTFNDDYDVIECKTYDFSDLFGADWAPCGSYDSPQSFYRLVRSTATRIYGDLPF